MLGSGIEHRDMSALAFSIRAGGGGGGEMSGQQPIWHLS